MRITAGRLMLPLSGLASAYYLAKFAFPESSLFTHVLTPDRHEAIGSFAKLACLGIGAVFGALCVRRLERDNPSRLPWLLIALWLAAFTLGQLGLTAYSVVLRVPAPLPSIADVGFLVGYVLMIAAAVRFVFVMRGSGFPVGRGRTHAAFAGATFAVLGVMAYVVLTPIALAATPLAERLVNVAYPALDFAALVPTLLMIRIALAFRPGRIWTVWASLLAGIVFMAVGDILFAYLSTARAKAIEPLVDLSLLLGYFFAACGAKLQHELLSE